MRELLPWGGHGLYDRFVGRPLAAFYSRLASQLPPGRALDIGCGPGHLAHALSRTRLVVALDKDPRQVVIARRNHPDLDVQEGDAADLPFAANSFDLVVTSESYHHWADTEASVAEVSRVLRPEGHFVVIEGCADVGREEAAAFMNRRPWPGLTLLARAVFRNHGYSKAGLEQDVLAVLARHFESVDCQRIDGWWLVTARNSTA